MSKSLWEKCVDFHGHECGGLTIGFKASQYAAELLDLDFSRDEEIVCISENDACGVDAIQALLGCSVGKGNLLFRIRGKQAFSFYNRKNGKSVRLVLKPRPAGMTKDEAFAFYQEASPKDMFEVKEVKVEIPERARLFNSHTCDQCKETTAEHLLILNNGEKHCYDCYLPYNRFDV